MSIVKKNFNKNVLRLLTGTSIAQALPMIISPILTRLFSPEDFGVVAIFTAICVLLGSVSSMRYEVAIVLPERKEEAIKITFIALLSSFLFSVLLFFLVVLLSDHIKEVFKLSVSNWVLFYIPVVVFLIGLYNILNFYNTRISDYRTISKSNIQRSVSLVISQLLFGFLKFGWIGLMIGQVISQITSISKMSKNLIKEISIFKQIKRKELIEIAKEYRRFPKYSMPAIFINNLSQQINVFFIPIISSNAVLGVYSIVIRIVATPFILIGGAISQVYYENAVKEKNNNGSCVNIFKSTFKKLIFISIPLFVMLYIVLNNFVVLIFGSKWEEIVDISNILLPLFFVRFISSTLSITLTIFGKEKEFFMINLVLLLLSIFPFLISSYFNLDIFEVLKIQAVLLSTIYGVLLYRYYAISKIVGAKG